MRRFALAVLLSSTVLAPLAAQTRVPAELKPNLDQPIDADATAKIRKYTTAPEFNSPLTDYLPASTDRAEPERGARRRRRGAGDPAVRGGRAPLLPDAGRGEPAGAGDLDRDERGGARADRGGGQLRDEPRAAEGERRAARATGRPAAPQARRRAGRGPDHRERAGLLHHGHHPLPGDRRAHRADGARLPAGGRREPVHPAHPRQRDHPDHAGRRGRRPRPHGGRLPLAPRASQGHAAPPGRTGATTWRTTTTATPWG